MSEEKKEEKKLPAMLDGSNVVVEEASPQEETEEVKPPKKSDEPLEVGSVVVSEKLQERFNRVVGQKGDMERQRDAARERAEAAETKLQEYEQRLAALENKATEPVQPSEDATPAEWSAYTTAMVEHKLKEAQAPVVEQRRVQEQAAQYEADDQVARFAQTHPDFADLHKKYWNDFSRDPNRVAQLEASVDPLNDFYIMARVQEGIDRANAGRIDLGAQAAQAAMPTPPITPEKKREFVVSEVEYMQYKKMFPGVKVTREELDDIVRKERGL